MQEMFKKDIVFFFCFFPPPAGPYIFLFSFLFNVVGDRAVNTV